LIVCDILPAFSKDAMVSLIEIEILETAALAHELALGAVLPLLIS
jgi:hypothetical protein